MKNFPAEDAYRLLRDAGGNRVAYRMPEALAGRVRAELIGRSPLLDGTDGLPSKIERRMAHILNGDALVAPWQVHGTAIAEARAIWAFPQRVRADGVHLDASFDARRRVTASLRFADCTPVLIASPSPRPWAMILHSGFPGTTKNILRSAMERAKKFYGRRFNLNELFVWIGPAIGICCYNRRADDPSTVAALRTWNTSNLRRENEWVYFNLIDEIRDQARSCGVPGEHIFQIPNCTRCDSDRFYSYRSGDRNDRMILLAKII